MATTYSTTAAVEQRIGAQGLKALTNPDAAGTAYDSDEVDRARLKAYGLIRGRVGVRYDLPSASAVASNEELAGLLRELELDIVEWSLWANRRTDIPARVQKKYEATMAFLADVAAGKAALPSVGELPPSSRVDNQAIVIGPERAWTRDDARGVF